MVAGKLKPTTIEEYIDAAPVDLQERLWQLHGLIVKAAPGAEQGLKWGMPAYSYQKILVTFAIFKNHIGFYPMESAVKAFAKELKDYNTKQGSIQFPHDQALPIALIRKIIKFRVAESKLGVIKWRS